MTIIYFVLILGIVIFIHEFGHFLFAKKSEIYCYEFSLGMGPKLFSFNRKNDETLYVIRLFPIGGFVKMAGEEVDDDEKIPKNQKIQSKTFLQKFLTISAGAIFNFILGIFLLILIGLIFGSPETKPILGEISEDYNAYIAGLKKGDLILEVDSKKVNSWDDVLLALELKEKGEKLELKIKNAEGETFVNIEPTLKNIDGDEVYIYGISPTNNINHGLLSSIRYAFNKFFSIIKTMFVVVGSLITGALGLSNLSGPVGIYNIVGEQAKMGFENIIYLVAFLSINVGFVNLIPFPAFDGGRLLFLIIEKIRKKPIDSKVENIIHTVGFALLMLLMIVITIKDVTKIFS